MELLRRSIHNIKEEDEASSISELGIEKKREGDYVLYTLQDLILFLFDL